MTREDLIAWWDRLNPEPRDSAVNVMDLTSEELGPWCDWYERQAEFDTLLDAGEPAGQR
jgi:hypothetical protein